MKERILLVMPWVRRWTRLLSKEAPQQLTQMSMSNPAMLVKMILLPAKPTMRRGQMTQATPESDTGKLIPVIPSSRS